MSVPCAKLLQSFSYLSYMWQSGSEECPIPQFSPLSLWYVACLASTSCTCSNERSVGVHKRLCAVIFPGLLPVCDLLIVSLWTKAWGFSHPVVTHFCSLRQCLDHNIRKTESPTNIPIHKAEVHATILGLQLPDQKGSFPSAVAQIHIPKPITYGWH
jgi:hypothetical protein